MQKELVHWVYQNLMPLATDIYSGNVFRFTKLEQSMAEEDSELEKTSSEMVVGTHFTIRKKKSDENSGVQKVQNQNNCGIPRNSERISQPRAVGNNSQPKVWHPLGLTLRCTHTGKGTVRNTWGLLMMSHISLEMETLMRTIIWWNLFKGRNLWQGRSPVGTMNHHRPKSTSLRSLWWPTSYTSPEWRQKPWPQELMSLLCTLSHRAKCKEPTGTGSSAKMQFGNPRGAVKRQATINPDSWIWKSLDDSLPKMYCADLAEAYVMQGKNKLEAYVNKMVRVAE